MAGDLDTAEAFQLAEELFGNIPPGPDVDHVAAPPVRARRARIVHEDRVELPRLYLAWPSPPLFGRDDAELDLSADLLANGRTSRLYRSLIHEQRIATELAASQSSRELASTFQIVATAAPGHTLTEIQTRIDEELRRVAESGPSVEEMERSVAQAEAHFMYRLQTVGGFGGKSDQLNAYNVLRGNPGFFAGDLDRYRHATRESLQAAAQAYLALDRRVALSVIPRGQHALALEGSTAVSVS